MSRSSQRPPHQHQSRSRIRLGRYLGPRPSTSQSTHGRLCTRPGARAAASVAKPLETPSPPAVAGAPARVRPRDANARDAAPTAALAHTERGRPVLERGSELGAPRSVGSGFASWRSGSCKLGIFKTRSARRSPSRQSRSPPSRTRNSNSPRKCRALATHLQDLAGMVADGAAIGERDELFAAF